MKDLKKISKALMAMGIIMKQISKEKNSKKQMIKVYDMLKALIEFQKAEAALVISLGDLVKQNREYIAEIQKQANKAFHKIQTDIAELERQLKALKKDKKRLD